MGREEGGGFRMGNTCIPVADSFWSLVKKQQVSRAGRRLGGSLQYLAPSGLQCWCTRGCRRSGVGTEMLDF